MNIYGRIQWVDADGQRFAVDVFSEQEHVTLCRVLRRRHRTILKATRIRTGG